MRRFLFRCHHVLDRLDPRLILACSVLVLVLFGYLDYQTHFEIAVSLFYLMPIALVTWYVGPRAGWLLTGVGMFAWLAINLAADRTYPHEYIRYLNTFLRLFLFMGFIWLLNELKMALLHEHTQSHTDHLTGIHNSREFYRRADLELERMRRHPGLLSLAYVDVDNFKQVNDTFGHREGDRLLQVMAQSISAITRKTDTFARLGGDEFVLLLPDTDQDGARTAMQKMELAIAHGTKNLATPLTISVGVITFTTAPSSVDSMLQEADALMYEAKVKGKNRILYDQH